MLQSPGVELISLSKLDKEEGDLKNNDESVFKSIAIGTGNVLESWTPKQCT